VIFYSIPIVTRAAADAYQARFSPNRQTLPYIAICAVFCTSVILVPTPLWIRILAFGFFGLGGLVIVAASLTFQTALRVDPAGIMIRRYAFQPGSVMFYPWEDVDLILIWKYNHIKRLGIQRRDGAPPLPPRRIRPAVQNYLAVSAPEIPLDLAATATTASGWHLNEHQLVRAVTRFAPTVKVVDITNGRTLHAGTEQGQNF
jgi:hypothetical protein